MTRKPILMGPDSGILHLRLHGANIREKVLTLCFGHPLQRWMQQTSLKHSYLPWPHVSKDPSLEDT
jgi:hypothetical protein